MSPGGRGKSLDFYLVPHGEVEVEHEKPTEDLARQRVGGTPKHGERLILGVPNSTAWHLNGGERMHLPSRALGALIGGIGERRSISLTDVLQVRSGLDKAEGRTRILLERFVLSLILSIEAGKVTVEGGTADTGIHVLRGGLTNA